MTDAPERWVPRPKADREQWLFRAVYDPAAHHSVVHQDRPDFVATRRPGARQFGVEVTELHRTEADARLLHHPTYFTELLAGTRRMHADDPATLGVSTVTVSDKDGNVKHEGLQVLIRQNPTEAEHSNALAALIRAKDAKASQYQSGLSHVCLVVLDTFEAGAEPEAEYSTAHLLGPELRAGLSASRFDEVFLVAPDSDGVLWHRPLRMLLLFEAFQLFTGALDSYDGPLPDLQRSDAAGWFAAVTDLPGVVLGADPWKGPHRAYWGRYAVRCGESSTEVLDNYDLGVAVQPVPGAPPTIPADILGPLSAHVREFSRSQMFSCELWLRAPGLGDREARSEEADGTLAAGLEASRA